MSTVDSPCLSIRMFHASGDASITGLRLVDGCDLSDSLPIRSHARQLSSAPAFGNVAILDMTENAGTRRTRGAAPAGYSGDTRTSVLHTRHVIDECIPVRESYQQSLAVGRERHGIGVLLA